MLDHIVDDTPLFPPEASRPAVERRAIAFAKLSRINRWLVAGAVTVSGALSVFAANSFHGHTRGTAPQRSARASSARRAAASSAAQSSAGMQAAPPPVAVAPAPAPVVSGGS
jgi:hypothetical protein